MNTDGALPRVAMFAPPNTRKRKARKLQHPKGEERVAPGVAPGDNGPFGWTAPAPETLNETHACGAIEIVDRRWLSPARIWPDWTPARTFVVASGWPRCSRLRTPRLVPLSRFRGQPSGTRVPYADRPPMTARRARLESRTTGRKHEPFRRHRPICVHLRASAASTQASSPEPGRVARVSRPQNAHAFSLHAPNGAPHGAR